MVLRAAGLVWRQSIEARQGEAAQRRLSVSLTDFEGRSVLKSLAQGVLLPSTTRFTFVAMPINVGPSLLSTVV